MTVTTQSPHDSPHAVPAETPLPMPVQDLARVPGTHNRVEREKRFGWYSLRTFLARLLAFGGALALTAYACYQMVLIVSLAQITVFQWFMVATFTLTFAWIALAAASAITGVLLGQDKCRSKPDAPLRGRTALVMPVYNEDAARSFSALHAMAEALYRQGASEHFEIFILSDTRHPDQWVKETAAVHRLREALHGRMPVWYRRRADNSGKKAGNIADFVRRWGGHYDYMLVLDADSLLDAGTLTTLVREMNADPQCGILQTLPRLYAGKTLFARLQQFASNLYGPIVARGVTAWQADDGNYWGHNAIIRVSAFAAAAGLPTLPGRKPFGGPIMSHDFVEAALIRRAGWSVRMLPSLPGSWEESPPTLHDLALRDRRWAQGNIQHLRVLGTKGLRWPNRMHMVIGVMSYLASPYWLALIVAGLVTYLHAATATFDYFSEEFSLFPTWPIFDSERMIRLFVLTMGILLVPKLLGWVKALFSARFSGPVRVAPLRWLTLTLGVLLEAVFSILYAPVFMVIHTRHVWDILRGRDSGWQTQQRAFSNVPWVALCRRHLWQMLLGVSGVIGLFYLSPPLLAWMSPTLVGLVLAIPLAALSGNRWLARGLRAMGLLTTPEERQPPPIMADRESFETILREHTESLALLPLLNDPQRWRSHFDMVIAPPPDPRGQPDLDRVSAKLKIRDAIHTGEALDWLSDREKMSLLSHWDLFRDLLVLHQRDTPEQLTRIFSPDKHTHFSNT